MNYGEKCCLPSLVVGLRRRLRRILEVLEDPGQWQDPPLCYGTGHVEVSYGWLIVSLPGIDVGKPITISNGLLNCIFEEEMQIYG